MVKLQMEKYIIYFNNWLKKNTFSRIYFFDISYTISPQNINSSYWIGDICIILPMLKSSIQSYWFWTPNKPRVSSSLDLPVIFIDFLICISLFSGLFFQKYNYCLVFNKLFSLSSCSISFILFISFKTWYAYSKITY